MCCLQTPVCSQVVSSEVQSGFGESTGPCGQSLKSAPVIKLTVQPHPPHAFALALRYCGGVAQGSARSQHAESPLSHTEGTESVSIPMCRSHTSKQLEAPIQALGGHICSTAHRSHRGENPRVRRLKPKSVQRPKAQVQSLS